MRAKWLDRFGQCRVCGRRADGNLKSDRNDDMGPHCERCAKKLIGGGDTAAAKKSATRGVEWLARQEAALAREDRLREEDDALMPGGFP